MAGANGKQQMQANIEGIFLSLCNLISKLLDAGADLAAVTVFLACEPVLVGWSRDVSALILS